MWLENAPFLPSSEIYCYFFLCLLLKANAIPSLFPGYGTCWIGLVMLWGYYTKYCLQCHMVFSITMVTFLMSILRNKFTSCPTCKQLGIFCTLRIIEMKLLLWKIEICMENHLVSATSLNVGNILHNIVSPT